MQVIFPQNGPPRYSSNDKRGRLYSKFLNSFDAAKQNPKIFFIVFAVFGFVALVVVYAAKTK